MSSRTEEHLSEALHELVADQPFEPDPQAIERAGLRLRRRSRIVRRVVGVGVTMVVAAVAVSAVATIHPGTTTREATGTAAASDGGRQLVVRLANDIVADRTQQTGDATLELGKQSYDTGESIPRADLFADNGTYYFAHTRDALPAQVSGGHGQTADGLFTRELDAAVYASTGDLTVARQRMADAGLSPGSSRPVKSESLTEPDKHTGVTVVDNWIWENSQDALSVGAGNPQVRAGVLRLLSTLPEVTVTHTTTDGQPTLTLTAAAPALETGYQEALTINAANGVPVVFHGGPADENPEITITYQVSRVTLADVAAGKF